MFARSSEVRTRYTSFSISRTAVNVLDCPDLDNIACHIHVLGDRVLVPKFLNNDDLEDECEVDDFLNVDGHL